MTKIVHVITLEGEDEEVWPFNKDLRQHIQLLKESAEKEGRIVLTHEYAKDGKGDGLIKSGFSLLKKGWDAL